MKSLIFTCLIFSLSTQQINAETIYKGPAVYSGPDRSNFQLPEDAKIIRPAKSGVLIIPDGEEVPIAAYESRLKNVEIIKKRREVSDR